MYSIILAHTTAELRWFCYLCRELGITLRTPPLLFCDNISAIHMASNPVFHARTHHIEIDYHFIREFLARGVFRIAFVSSDQQLADILTKGLPRDQFFQLASKLKLHCIPFRLKGSKSN